MSTAITKQNGNAALMEKVLMAGDLSQLQPDQRVRYYNAVCESVGLNPLTQPFEYIKLNGKLVLYAKKACTDQLRSLHKVRITSISQEKIADLYVVTAHAVTPDGREDADIGAVTIGNLKGDALANALMKATTKAKRRVTLSICGLGFLDESELETIPPSAKQPANGDAAPPPAGVNPDRRVVIGEAAGPTTSAQPDTAAKPQKPDNTQPPGEAEIWSRTMGNMLKARGVKSVKASVEEICNVYGVVRLSEAYHHRDEIQAAIEAGEFDAPQQTTQAA